MWAVVWCSSNKSSSNKSRYLHGWVLYWCSRKTCGSRVQPLCQYAVTKMSGSYVPQVLLDHCKWLYCWMSLKCGVSSVQASLCQRWVRECNWVAHYGCHNPICKRREQAILVSRRQVVVYLKQLVLQGQSPRSFPTVVKTSLLSFMPKQMIYIL